MASMSASSALALSRTFAHLLLSLILFAILKLIARHPKGPSSSSSPFTAIHEGALGQVDLVGWYALAGTTLLGVYVCRLTELLVGFPSPSKDLGALRGNGRDGGIWTLERWGTLVAFGVWGGKHVLLLRQVHRGVHARTTDDNWILFSIGTTIVLLALLTLTHVLEALSNSSSSMVGPTSTEDGKQMLVPLIVVTFEKEDVTLPERTTDAEESGRVASLMDNSFILGLMLGCTLIVGASAVWITSILAWQPATLMLLPVGLSVPLFLLCDRLSTPQLIGVISAALLVWYHCTMLFTLDVKGAPTCGIWDPAMGDDIRRFELLLCYLSKAVYFVSWTVIGGLLVALFDIHLVLPLAHEDLEEEDGSFVDEIRDNLSLFWAGLMGPLRGVQRVCQRKDGAIHLV